MKLMTTLLSLLLLLSACGNTCKDGGSELLEAVKAGNIDVLKQFLEGGNDPKFSCYDIRYGKFGTTYELHNSVASSNNFEMIKLFVENSDLPQTHLNEMLFSVINDQNIPIARYLMSKGAVLNKSAGDFYFSRSQTLNDTEFTELMGFLLSQGVDFSTSTEDKTNLYFHVQKNAYRTGYSENYERNMRFLSSQKHDINHASEPGYFLNSHICTFETEEFELALELGADPALKDRDGDTALIDLMCCNEHIPSFHEKLDLLVTAENNINEKNLTGETAISKARACGQDKTADYLTDLIKE